MIKIKFYMNLRFYAIIQQNKLQFMSGDLIYNKTLNHSSICVRKSGLKFGF